jgi:hypothetical protein
VLSRPADQLNEARREGLAPRPCEYTDEEAQPKGDCHAISGLRFIAAWASSKASPAILERCYIAWMPSLRHYRPHRLSPRPWTCAFGGGLGDLRGPVAGRGISSFSIGLVRSKSCVLLLMIRNWAEPSRRDRKKSANRASQTFRRSL